MAQVTFCLLLTALVSSTLSVDLTVQPDAKGKAVVQAVISKIEAAQIFDSDSRILRRIAYVETRDGESGTNNGGIWKLSNDNFQLTKEASEEPIDVARQKINKLFQSELSNVGRTWETLQRKDLNRPILSGLAARLWLLYIEEILKMVIPTASDIDGQAEYWSTHYNTAGDKNKFIEDVKQLIEDESCNVNSDIIFVLDSSGSIGPDNYREVINFTYRFVDELDIDGTMENQVGVIIFNYFAETIFNLSTFSDKGEILEAIASIPYSGGSTNTAEGLCLMLEDFGEDRGARVSEDNVFRLAIVLTDGHSNRDSPRCNHSTTIEVAEMVHNYSDPITVFAIGVTNNVNQVELEAIASRNEYITHLANFSGILFRRTVDEQTYELCEKVTIPVELGERQGTLSQGGTVRYVLEIPEEGLTVKLCVTMGKVTFYGSYTISNPNNAIHDYKEEVTSNGKMACGDVFVVPVESTTNLRKRQVSSSNTTSTLYIALEGGGEQNDFILETSEGDNTTPADEKEVFTITVIGLIAAGGVVILLGILACSCFLVFMLRRGGSKSNRPV